MTQADFGLIGLGTMGAALAVKYEATACAIWMGNAGAGHFVKAVHSGIEYENTRMLAVVYGVMRRGLGMSPANIGDTFPNKANPA